MRVLGDKRRAVESPTRSSYTKSTHHNMGLLIVALKGESIIASFAYEVVVHDHFRSSMAANPSCLS